MSDKFKSPETHAPSGSLRAADIIVRTIEKQIVSGALPDGTPLPAERELMQSFSASRTVVREAITALTSRGLIENKPRFRPTIRTPGTHTVMEAMTQATRHLMDQPSGVKNLYESRIFIERMLVRDAATDARKNDIKRLTDALADNQKAIEHADEFYITDMAFHAVLYEIPKNPIFPIMYQAFKSWLHPYWVGIPRSAERNYVNFRGHEAILAGILERDPDAAEAALNSHLNSAWEYVWVTLQEEPD